MGRGMEREIALVSNEMRLKSSEEKSVLGRDLDSASQLAYPPTTSSKV